MFQQTYVYVKSHNTKSLSGKSSLIEKHVKLVSFPYFLPNGFQRLQLQQEIITKKKITF
jgi:hypothetical protein